MTAECVCVFFVVCKYGLYFFAAFLKWIFVLHYYSVLFKTLWMVIFPLSCKTDIQMVYQSRFGSQLCSYENDLLPRKLHR